MSALLILMIVLAVIGSCSIFGAVTRWLLVGRHMPKIRREMVAGTEWLSPRSVVWVVEDWEDDYVLVRIKGSKGAGHIFHAYYFRNGMKAVTP